MKFNSANESRTRSPRGLFGGFPKTSASPHHNPVVAVVAREFVTAALFAAVCAGFFTARRHGRAIHLGGDGAAYLPERPTAFPAALADWSELGVSAALVDGMYGFYLRASFAARISHPHLCNLTSNGEQAFSELLALQELWLSLCSEALLVFHRMCDESSLDLDALQRDIELIRFSVKEIGDGRPYFVREDGTVFIPGWLELRRSERLSVDWSVTIRHNGRSQAAFLNNISRTGAGLTFMPPLESGTPVGLELPAGRVLHGMIVWNSQMHHGVEFFNPLAVNDPILRPEPPQAPAMLA